MDGLHRSPRVLVVEDDRDIAEVLQRSLRIEGYEVRCARDGSTALEEGRTFAPDLVILDLGLPGEWMGSRWHARSAARATRRS